MHSKSRYIIRVAVFMCILAVLFCGIVHLIPKHPDFALYQRIAGFYEEGEGTLLGVYIGSSDGYAFWNPLAAWHNYGINIFPYCSGSQPFYVAEYLIKEARKTQPNAMFIVNINSIGNYEIGESDVYNILSYMPESDNKTQLLNYLSDMLGYSVIERQQFRYTWLKFREDWYSMLNQGGFPKLDGLKGANCRKGYLEYISDLSNSSKYIVSDQKADLKDAQVESVNSLLDYCDEENVRILFVSVPRAEGNMRSLGRINTLAEMLTARGYDLLHLTDKTDEIGLDMSQDYYNGKHTNIHGSIKYTDYLCKYLREHYGLEDRRGDEAYASWDAGWEKYLGVVSPWALDFELEARRRDSALPAPTGLKAAADAAAVTVSWDAVEAAEEYRVYRKQGNDGAWQGIASTAELSYVDAGCEPGNTYHYTVVPVRDVDGETCYGNFSYQGVGVRVKAQ